MEGNRKLKVLHLISGGDIGGAKVQVLTLVKNLQKQNVEVKVLCFIKGIFYEEAVAMGLDIELIKQPSRLDMSVVDKIKAIVDSEEYDLIHSHGARANLISMLLKRKIKIPVITTIHSDYRLDFEDTFYKRWIFTPLNAIALRFMDYYITVSMELKEKLVERGFPNKKISYIFNGLDFESEMSYTPREEYFKRLNIPYDPCCIYIGILGRLHPVKGHKVFLEGAAEALKEAGHLRFIVGGDGIEIENLQKLCSKLQIEHAVHFVGFVQNPYDFFNAIDINALTSYSEGFPYALLEGAKMKKPTISSDVGDVSKLILSDRTGLLFPLGDHKAFGDHLITLGNSAERREQFGQQLFEYGKKHFSAVEMASQYHTVYMQVKGT
ncbi:glycosyltransferase family 4 protein [Geosporobacter ferrireducens]|uniref:Glycosyl transferase family 1 n=1 Tax=Geosporobacter ferrireducens TaxID=1424294 RepID=A0A1D8GLC9_9FIRM|nr:glycosyltransferase family 4 protein [Geosporobacter ferrireducens]AOT71712.1 hypothetical protein Gferi_20525 [Geosporobacter ferrireducens]